MASTKSYPITDLLSVDRASPGCSFGPDGSLVEYDANTARLDWDQATGAFRGLLIEPSGENRVPNPRGEGATLGVIGSGGALPTGWSGFTSNLPAGSVTVIGQETRRGVPGMVLKFAGTPTGTTANNSWLDAGETVSIGADVAIGVYVELLAGSLANVTSFSFRIGNESTATFFTPGAFARVETVRVLTGTAARTGLRWFYGNTSDAVDFTLWIGCPTREHATAVSPIPKLPPVGAPAVTTQPGDAATLKDVSRWASPGVGTVAVDFTIRTATATTTRGIFSADDGGASNRIEVLVNSSTAQVLLAVAAGGVVLVNFVAIGTADVLARNTVRVSWGPAGVFASLNGAAPIYSALASMPEGLSVPRLGKRYGGFDSFLDGWIGPRVQYYAQQYTDTAAPDGYTIRTR